MRPDPYPSASPTRAFACRRASLLLLAAVVLCTLGACMNSPRSGQWTQRGENIRFEGYSISPGVTATLQLFNQHSKNWEDSRSATTGDAKIVDAKGVGWYGWTIDATLWTASGKYLRPGEQDPEGRRSNAVDIRAIDSVKGGPTKTFNLGADQCMQDNQQNGAFAMMDACARQDDWVTIFVRCGQEEQNCCLSGAECDGGLSCTQDGEMNVCRPPPAPAPAPPPSPPPGPPSPRYPGHWWTVSCICGDDFGGAGRYDLEYCFDDGQTPELNWPCQFPRNILSSNLGRSINCFAADGFQSGSACNAVPGAVMGIRYVP
jgi:hypothetical protein